MHRFDPGTSPGVDHSRRLRSLGRLLSRAGSPYLGQAVLGEPVRRTNVLFPNRRFQ